MVDSFAEVTVTGSNHDRGQESPRTTVILTVMIHDLFSDRY